jgi:hypothetical protein
VAVGELTFYPGSGLVPISPRSFDLAMGEKWSSSTKPMLHTGVQLDRPVDRSF